MAIFPIDDPRGYYMNYAPTMVGLPEIQRYQLAARTGGGMPMPDLGPLPAMPGAGPATAQPASGNLLMGNTMPQLAAAMGGSSASLPANTVFPNSASSAAPMGGGSPRAGLPTGLGYLGSNEFLSGLGAWAAQRDAMNAPRLSPTPPATDPFAVMKGMQAGQKLDIKNRLGEIVNEKGWDGLMSDPDMPSLMAQFDTGGFIKGLMAEQAAKRKAANGTAPIQNYEYRNKLVAQFGEGSPQVRQYDAYVRATPWLNLGGTMALPNVQDPSRPAASLPKTLEPGDLPSTRGAQAEAAAIGKGAGENKATTAKQASDAGKLLDLTAGVEEVIKKSTGSGLGTMVDSLGRFFGVSTEGAVAGGTLKALQSSLLRFIPRLEGPQSDADRKAYEQAVGSLGDTTLTNDERRAALGEVRRIAEKYQFYGDAFVPGAGTTGSYAPISPAPTAAGKTSSGLNWKVKKTEGGK